MNLRRRFRGAGIRRDVRWAGSNASPVATVLALSPLFSYRPALDNVTLDGSNNVITLADEVYPGDSNYELTQGSASNRPEWMSTSGAPSAVPAVKGDAVSEYLKGLTSHAASVGTANELFLCLHVPNSTGINTMSAFGAGNDGGLTADSWFGGVTLTGGSPPLQLTSKYAPGSAYTVGTGVRDGSDHTTWVNLRYVSGAAYDYEDGLGASGTEGAVNPSTDAVYVAAIERNGGGLQAFSNVQLLWAVGWSTALSTADRAAVIAALESYIGGSA